MRRVFILPPSLISVDSRYQTDAVFALRNLRGAAGQSRRDAKTQQTVDQRSQRLRTSSTSCQPFIPLLGLEKTRLD